MDKNENDSHWKIGENYFIRSVTMYYTGKLLKVSDQELVLEGAAWIADTGRFHNGLKDGTFSEVEPFLDGEVIIGRGALLDASIWKHPLPREQK